MFLGQQRVIQEGQAGQANVLSRVVKRCGIPVASNDLNAVTVTEATPLIVGTGTKAMPELPEGCLFLWPVQGTITSEFGYRYIFGETNFHRGLDIAAEKRESLLPLYRQFSAWLLPYDWGRMEETFGTR